MIRLPESSISRYRKLDLRNKFLVWAVIALIIGLLIALLYIFRSQSTSTGKSVQSAGYQAGGKSRITQVMPKVRTFSGNADVARGAKQPFSDQLFPRQGSRGNSRSYEAKVIQSIIVEERVTYEVRDGAKLPPAEVPFTPEGNTYAYLHGPDNNVRLDFMSPVGFELKDDGDIVVTTHFSLQSTSDWYLSPVEILKNFDYISLPAITAGYGTSLNKMVSFEATLSVNGKDILLSGDRESASFQQDTIRISLERLKRSVRNVNPPKDR